MPKAPKGWQAVRAWTERLAYHKRKFNWVITKPEVRPSQPAIPQGKRLTKS